MASPAAALKEVADELKEKFEEAGMSTVDAFVDKLEDIKDNAASAPKEILDQIQSKFKEFTDKLEEFMKDPSKLAPPPLQAIAAWYGGAVAGKLKAMSDESSSQLEAVAKMASSIMEPMKKLGEVLTKAMEELEGSLKKLSKLPAEVGKLASTVSSPDDIAKIDVEPMKKALDVSGIDSPLKSIEGLKGMLGDVVAMAKSAIEKVVEFIQSCPGMIKGAFEVPFPFCCMTSVIMDQAPDAMKQLLDGVSAVEKIDLNKLLDIMSATSDTVCNLDIAAVKQPVEKFAASSGDAVGKLEKTVSGAKMAGGLGSIGEMF
jgi:ElaB/YqjD/DUF883 family membrane-anchored ribosome-binding protein